MSSNPPKRTAVASFVVALFAAFMIFVPEMVGIDGFDGIRQIILCNRSTCKTVLELDNPLHSVMLKEKVTVGLLLIFRSFGFS